ncbi:uncharacterized protein LOC105165934 [Sesamum indicum]|uniref:Uncharacterized protein LOC105165934 n=1 Tax=Sesamum indicum TaxID=4182 RepID=A0A6I9TF16_SESIN|nr:uncharacterized protein LOC105165934 [Sesamum indicum]
MALGVSRLETLLRCSVLYPVFSYLLLRSTPYIVTRLHRVLQSFSHSSDSNNMEVGSDEGSSMPRHRGRNHDRLSRRRAWTIMKEECLIAALRNLVAEPHITSKLHVWKKHYSTLTTMLTRSGFGWDDSRNMVTVEEDSVWDDYVKMDPSAKGMRHKTWPFLPSWREIFGRDRATGERSANPFKEANDIRDEEIGETHECNVRDDGCILEPAEDRVEGEPVSSFNASVDPTQNSSSAAKRTGGSSSKKRKSTYLYDGIPKLVEMVTNFCESANARLGKLTRQVRELEGFDENEQLMVANRLVKDPKEMELFLGLTRDSRVKFVHLMLAGKI